MQQNSKINGFKYSRVLRIYTKLMMGEIVNKAEAADSFGVNQRSVQRDIDDLRAFFDDRNSEGAPRKEIVYSRELGGFYLKMDGEDVLSDSEVLAVCRAVLSCRQIEPDDRSRLAAKLLKCCVPGRKQEELSRIVFGEADSEDKELV